MSDALTTTVNLRDEIEKIEGERLPALRAHKQSIVQEAREAEATPDSKPGKLYERRYETAADEIAELEALVTALERANTKWGGERGEAIFELKELNFGEVGRAQYETTKRSYQVDQHETDQAGVLHTNYYQVMVLRLGIVDAPAAAPDDPKDYTPWKISEHLYEIINNLSSFGDPAGGGVELGNSSLWDEMQSSSSG